MVVTNLDKFKEIETLMLEYQGYKDDYLKSLLDRHEYMNQYRSEYRKLIKSVQGVQGKLNKRKEITEEYSVLLKVVRSQIQAQIERLEEEDNNSLYEDYSKRIEALKEHKSNIYSKPHYDYLEDAQRTLIKEQVNSSELQLLLDNYKDVQGGNNEIDELLKLIKTAQQEYLSSFKVYRKACEESEEVYESFNDIFEVLLEMGFDDESLEISEALPDIEDQRKERPDPQPLLNALQPIKSAGLEYFQSKNKNSHAHDFNVAFAREIAYTRRALLEDREYIGTRNAFERLENSFDDLSEYMYERYYQLGGVPVNFHGHDDRK